MKATSLACALTICASFGVAQDAGAKGLGYAIKTYRLKRMITRTDRLTADQKTALLGTLEPALRKGSVSIKFKGGLLGLRPTEVEIGMMRNQHLLFGDTASQLKEPGLAAFSEGVAEGAKQSQGEWLEATDLRGGNKQWAGDQYAYLANRLFLAVKRGDPSKVRTLKGLSSAYALANGVQSHMDGSPLVAGMHIKLRPMQKDVMTVTDGKPATTAAPGAVITTVVRWKSAANMPAAYSQDVIELQGRKGTGVFAENGFSDGLSLRMPDQQPLEIAAPAKK